MGNRPVLWRASGCQLGYGARAVPLGRLTEAELVAVRLGVRTLGVNPDEDVPAERWVELSEALDRARPEPFAEFPFRPVPADTHPLTRELCAILGAVAARSALPLVVFTHWYVTDPQRVAPLMREDAPFLPVVVDDDGASIGPVIRPGETACPRCLELARTEVEPEWPVLATQLHSMERRAVNPVMVRVAAAAGAAGIATSPELGWRIERGAVMTFEVARHPACGCADPAPR